MPDTVSSRPASALKRPFLALFARPGVLALLALTLLSACGRVAPPQSSLKTTASPLHVAVGQWGGFGSGPGTFKYPHGVAVDRQGNVYVTDRNNSRVQKFAADGTFVTSWGRQGSEPGQFLYPLGVATDADGYVYVVDASNNRVQKFTADGAFVTAWGDKGSADGQFGGPNGIAVDGGGYVYVTETGGDRVQKFTADGTFVKKWGRSGSADGQFTQATGIAVSSDGHVYVGDVATHRIQRFSTEGVFKSAWGTNGSGAGQFRQPHGLAVGGDGRVFVADKNNLRVQVFTPDGAVLGQWSMDSSEQPVSNYPLAVAVGASDRVYVTDMFNSLVQVFAPAPVGSVHVLVKASGRGTFARSAALRAALSIDSDPLAGAAVNFFLNGVAVGSGVTDAAHGRGGKRPLRRRGDALGDAGGAGVAGQTLSFSLNGRPVGSALTDARGGASVRNVALTGTTAGRYEGAVTVSFAGTEAYAGAQASGVLAVGKAAQTLTFAALPAAAQVGGDYPVTADSSAGLPVPVVSESESVCRVVGGRVSFGGVGTCTLRASQPGDQNHEAAPEVVRQIAVTVPALTLKTYALTFDRLTLGRVVWHASLGNGVVSTDGTNRNRVALYAKRRDRGGNVAVVAGTQRQLLISSDGRAQRSYARGGYLDVMFKPFDADLVTVRSLKVYGATTAGGTVEVFGPGGLVKRLSIPKTSSSGSTTLRLDAADVLKLRVNLTGPGRVDDVVFESAK